MDFKKVPIQPGTMQVSTNRKPNNDQRSISKHPIISQSIRKTLHSTTKHIQKELGFNNCITTFSYSIVYYNLNHSNHNPERVSNLYLV